MCLKEIGPCAQTMLSNSRLNSQYDLGGDIYDYLMHMRIFVLIMNNTFI